MVVAAHKLYSAANFIYPLDRRPFPFSSLLISLDVGHSPGPLHPFHGFFHGTRQGLAEEAVHGISRDKPGAARFPPVPFMHAGGSVAGSGSSTPYGVAVPVPDTGGFYGGENEKQGIQR